MTQSIFNVYREYPCDHYTSIINVTLMSTGCPRAPVHDAALQLLQLLDQRFFGNVGPLPATEPETSKFIIVRSFQPSNEKLTLHLYLKFYVKICSRT